MKYYTGIGSRKTPQYILDYFEKVAMFLARKGYTFRSGHAPQADQAFEKGCDKANGEKEIYLPWKRFEGSDSKLILDPNDEYAFTFAQQFCKHWYNVNKWGKFLLARDGFQVLGKDLDLPFKNQTNQIDVFSEFVLCWTKKGKIIGVSAQVINVALHYGIPIFNAGLYNDINMIKKELKSFLLEYSSLTEDDFKRKEQTYVSSLLC